MLNNPRFKAVKIPATFKFFNTEKKIAEKKASDLIRSIETHGWPWANGYFDFEGNKYFENRSGKVFASFKDCFLSEFNSFDWEFVNSQGGWEDLASSLAAHPRPVSLEILTESFLEFKKSK